MGYDFRAGACRNLTTGQYTVLEGGRVQSIYHGDFVTIETKESVNLRERADIFGLVFSKVSYTGRGLSHVGTKIDPGYVGKLRLSFENRGYEVFEIDEKTRICNVAFLQVPNGGGELHFPTGSDFIPSTVERSPLMKLPFPLSRSDSVDKENRQWFSMEVMDAYVRLSEELTKFQSNVDRNLEKYETNTTKSLEKLKSEVDQNLLRAEHIYSGAILTTFIAAIAVVTVLVSAAALFVNQLRMPYNSVLLSIGALIAGAILLVSPIGLLVCILRGRKDRK